MIVEETVILGLLQLYTICIFPPVYSLLRHTVTTMLLFTYWQTDNVYK